METNTAPCGFLVLDKARGKSSHQALSPLKRSLGERRIGHAGTLDPLATGVLLAAAGKATRLLPLAEGRDKEYLVALRLGLRTDTLDTDGQELSQSGTVPGVDAVDWDELARPFLGWIDQIPPAHSAISVGGVRSYERARRGEAVELPARRVRIDAVEALSGESPLAGTGWEPGDPVLRVRCGKGTYVRSLVRDLGEILGCGATVSALRRTAIGPWRLSDRRPEDPSEPELLAPERAFPEIPVFEVDSAELRPFSNGNPIGCPLPDADDVFARHEGRILAWGRSRSGRFHVAAML